MTLQLGVASALGDLPITCLSTANNLDLRSAWCFAQLAAPDASQAGLPIALSSANTFGLPNRIGGPAPVHVRHTLNTTSITAPIGSVPTTSAAVTRYTY